MAFTVAELEILRHPLMLSRLRRLRQHVHTDLGPLQVDLATSKEPVAFDDRLSLRYRRVRPGSTWGRAFTCGWFHVTGQVPPGRQGHVALILDTDGEALVRDASGAVVGALTSRTTPVEQLGSPRGKTRLDLTEAIAPDGRIDLWLDAGFNGKLVPPLGRARIKRLELVTVRDDVEALYHDTLVASYAALAARDPGLAKRYRRALTTSERAWGTFTPDDVAAARAELAPLLAGTPAEGLQVTSLGHGHLDLAWLWPIRETRRKAERTLTYQLDQLAQRPGEVYGVSQPQQLAWLEEQAPDLFARVQQAVAAGRVEIQGGMWVEPDTNLPSGESLVRQILLGQRYWQAKFGRRPDFCWLPDVFGYSGNLPQLLRKGGMERFLTIKLSWNEHNDFPHRSFRWVGIDGSEVLVHMPPEGSYNSSASPLALRMLLDNYPEQAIAPLALLVYGSGDGGGGPGPAHHEQLARLTALEGFPSVRPGTAGLFFEALERYRPQLPAHAGELYLEKHQGTYTTQAANKRWNRTLEHRLHDVELLATLAWADGAPYPADLLESTWREVLLYQFHDILPGSSITRVHRESVERYHFLDAGLRREQDALLAARPGPLSFVNTLPTRRTGFHQHDGEWLAYDAPPLATVALTRSAGPHDVEAEGNVLRNSELEVRFADDGSIASLVDRATGRDHAGAGLNRLVVHRDPWSYFDAWDINMSYLGRPGTHLTPDSATSFVDGPRAVRRQTYRHGRSRITQDLVLTAGEPWLVVETTVDWHETWRMLRAEFRPTAWSDDVTCQIQYGHLTRSTRDETPQEKAQFEICAHQWLDASDADGGLSLLNDVKYGHRVKEGLISLTLLRSPVYPDRHADRGTHHFRYALHPHAGAVVDSRTAELAAHLNAPVVVADTEPRPAPFTIDGDGVLLDAVKVSEDGDAIILRLHEWRGRPATVRPTTRLPVAEVAEVNLLEEDARPVDPASLAFSPFEIRTLRLRLRR